jgi:hypothetical protein
MHAVLDIADLIAAAVVADRITDEFSDSPQVIRKVDGDGLFPVGEQRVVRLIDPGGYLGFVRDPKSARATGPSRVPGRCQPEAGRSRSSSSQISPSRT